MTLTRNTKALVTLTVGQRYAKLWGKYCRPSWEAYAHRHGYDIISLDQPLDKSLRAQQRSPAWQKCLILQHETIKNYERVVWIDSDVVINANSAPDISSGVPIEKVGAVDERGNSGCVPRSEVLRRQVVLWSDGRDIGETTEHYYLSFGLPSGFPHIVQTGVLVLSPQHHHELLLKTYNSYEDKGRECQYEMRPLSWELLSANAVYWIDPRFNLLWIDEKCTHYPFLFPRRGKRPTARFERLWMMLYNRLTVEKRCADAALRNSYFLHFAAHPNNVSLVSQRRAEKLF